MKPGKQGGEPAGDCEEEAVRRCQGGDSRAFEGLYRALAPRALQVAYLITGDRASAEDCLQEAALRAWRAIGGFTPGRPFRPWFLKFVVNEALKARRNAGRTVPFDPTHPAAPWAGGSGGRAVGGQEMTCPGPAAEVGRLELRAKVIQALDVLDANHRAPLVLFYFEGMSEGEVAQALGMRRSTVKSRLHTARRRVAEHLQREGVNMEW